MKGFIKEKAYTRTQKNKPHSAYPFWKLAAETLYATVKLRKKLVGISVLAILCVFVSFLVLGNPSSQPESIQLNTLDVVDCLKGAITFTEPGTTGLLYMYDADPNTAWSSDNGSDLYVTFDLGGVYNLTEIVLDRKSGANSNVNHNFIVYAARTAEELASLNNHPASLLRLYADNSFYAIGSRAAVGGGQTLKTTITDPDNANAMNGVRYLKVYRGERTAMVYDIKVKGIRQPDVVSDARIRTPVTILSPATGAEGVKDGVVGDKNNAKGYYNMTAGTPIILDLGGYYDLSRVDVFRYAWQGGDAVTSVTVSAAGKDQIYKAFGTPFTVPHATDWFPDAAGRPAQAMQNVRYVKLEASVNWRVFEIRVHGKLVQALDLCTINIDPKNGLNTTAIQIERGSAFGTQMPAEPVKSGSIFGGWFYMDGGKELPVAADTKVTKDISIYAKWNEPIAITEAMIVSGGPNGSAAGLFDGKTDTGHAGDAGTNKVLVDLGGYYKLDMIRVYRRSVADKYTTSVSIGKTASGIGAPVIHIDPQTTQPINQWTYYYEKGNELVRYVLIEKIDWNSAISEIQICGVKKEAVPEYTVIFNTNGGTAVNSIKLLSERALTMPNPPTRPGYRFEGWFLDTVLKTPFNPMAAVTGNLTLYAKWVNAASPMTFTVMFDVGGGNAVAPMTGVVNGTSITLPIPVREGHRFDSWCRKSNFTDIITTSTLNITENITLYAKWTPIGTKAPKIPLTESNIVTKYQTVSSDGTPHQNKMPHILDGNPRTYWGVFQENEVLLDLGAFYNISQISMYFAQAQPNYRVFAGKTQEDLTMIVKHDEDPAWGNVWSDEQVNTVARYIMISRGSNIAEVVIYGRKVPTSGYSLQSVTDLKVSYTDSDDPYTELTWTTPGMTGYDGTADKYEIRYSTSPITDANFASATLLTKDDFIEGDAGIPIPEAKGLPQSVRIYCLKENTRYYFAVKTVTNWTKELKSGLSNVTSLTTPKDNIPPAAIDNLKVKALGSTRVYFSLTATGDNGKRGKAVQYDLRYRTDGPVTAENWSTAMQVTGLSAPNRTGTEDVLLAVGLKPDTAYYFAIKAKDQSGNVSELSNILDVMTWHADKTAPTVINDMITATEGSTITLKWTAPYDDGALGQAFIYHVRYSTAPITEANWGKATAVSSLPTPAAAGYEDTVTFTVPKRGAFYYAAVRSEDVDGNISSIKSTQRIAVGALIKLNPDALIPELMWGNDEAVMDEQEQCGDPTERDNGFRPKTRWTHNRYNLLDFTKGDVEGMVIDLGAEYQLTDLYFFYHDLGGRDSVINVYTGMPFRDWSKPTATYKVVYTNVGKWVQVPVNAKTRYVRLTAASMCPFPTEVLAYGIKTGNVDLSKPPEQYKRPTMDAFMGINAFIDDGLDVISVAGNVREYHNWRWDMGNPLTFPNNKYGYSPSAAGNSWSFDDYYTRLNKAGIFTMTCIQGGVRMEELGGIRGLGKPVLATEDPESPFSYARFADTFFQFAARYGSKTVPDNMLKLLSNQPRVSGLNVVQAVEVLNEMNGYWNDGRAGYYTPYECAAMLSAAYDGHCGALGADIGAKNADPDIEVVMGGSAGSAVDVVYARAMQFWFKFNRPDGKFAADTINFHTYINTANNTQAQTADTVGVAPEAGGLKKEGEILSEFRDKYMPDTKVILSEFGYDTNLESPQGVRPYGALSAREIQAQWLMRSFLVLSSSKLDAAQMYMLRDAGEESSNSVKYNTSGLITMPGENQQKKTSWYYMYTMKNALKGMRFVKEIPTGNPDVWLYQYRNDDGKDAYAVWCPTSEDKKVRDFVFKPADGKTEFTLIKPVDKSTVGENTHVTAADGSLTVEWVSETPQFLVEGQQEVYDYLNGKKEPGPVWAKDTVGTYKQLTAGWVEISWPAPQSEQDIAYYSIYKNGKKFIVVSGQDNSYRMEMGEREAFDIEIYAGNIRGLESEVALKLDKPVDFIKPSRPRNVEVLMTNQNQIALKWEASTDNRTLSGNLVYRVYNGDTVVAEGANTTLVISELNPNGTYDLAVTAVDAAGNESERSKQVSALTAWIQKNLMSKIWWIPLVVVGAAGIGIGAWFCFRHFFRGGKSKPGNPDKPAKVKKVKKAKKADKPLETA